MRMTIYSLLVNLLALYPSLACSTTTGNPKLAPIHHIIVFYLENHSFDNLFGTFPGADNSAPFSSLPPQIDGNGVPYRTLPPVLNNREPDSRFPASLPNAPFPITRYVDSSEPIGDLVHRFYQTQTQIDGGRMDKFVADTDAGALTMGYYDGKNSPLWDYAKRFTLADHFFTAAFGGSMLNHFWLICACTPHFDNAPDTLKAVLNDKGMLLKDGALSPDGYVVNTIQPVNPPFDAKSAVSSRLPASTLPTIGERLSEKSISWAWYGGGWRDADHGNPGKLFQYHHHPFTYFAAYAPGSAARAEHIKDEDDFRSAIANGRLPEVVFYKPMGEIDMHPGYTALAPSEAHVMGLVHDIEKSQLWNDSLIIVTFDDAGGFWDHVAPPKADRFGPGVRIPTLIISPFAKKGYIDHTSYDTTSILKLIETKFELTPLGTRDAQAGDLINALK